MAVIFESVILQRILVIDILSISSEIAPRWNTTELHSGGESTLVQVMDGCHKATSHNLN